MKTAYKDTKNFLSTKSTVTRQPQGPLPSIGAIPRQAPQTGTVLPPIRAKPTPSRDPDLEAGSSDQLPTYNDVADPSSRGANNNYNNHATSTETSFTRSDSQPNGITQPNGRPQSNGSATNGMFVTSQSRTVISTPATTNSQIPELTAQQREVMVSVIVSA